MPFEDLAVCGKNQVRKVVKRFSSTHLLSIVDPGDRMPTPHRIQRENHFFIRFDDVEEPNLPHAPTSEDLGKIISWVDQLPRHARIVIHCTAGVSRSTAVALALLCREDGIDCAINKLLEIRPQASPNALMTALFDRMLKMDGALHTAAMKIRSADVKRPLPEVNL